MSQTRKSRKKIGKCIDKFEKVGATFVDQSVNGEPESVKQDIFQYYVPLKHSLKIFSQIPNMFENICNYIEYLKFQSIYSNIVTNLMQARLWQRKYANEKVDGILLPLFLYYDDFECGNPLGSHVGVNKFGALYASIGCLPPEISSKLSTIIFSSIICAKDAQHCSLQSRISRVVKELNFLRTKGITIKVNGSFKKIVFSMC